MYAGENFFPKRNEANEEDVVNLLASFGLSSLAGNAHFMTRKSARHYGLPRNDVSSYWGMKRNGVGRGHRQNNYRERSNLKPILRASSANQSIIHNSAPATPTHKNNGKIAGKRSVKFDRWAEVREIDEIRTRSNPLGLVYRDKRALIDYEVKRVGSLERKRSRSGGLHPNVRVTSYDKWLLDQTPLQRLYPNGEPGIENGLATHRRDNYIHTKKASKLRHKLDLIEQECGPRADSLGGTSACGGLAIKKKTVPRAVVKGYPSELAINKVYRSGKRV